MQKTTHWAIWSAMAACALFFVASGASAADGARIGYVDLDRVSEKATFVRDLMSGLEKDLNAKRSELEEKQERYARLRREIEQRKAVLKESEIESRLRESRRLRSTIEQLEYEINRMFRRAEKQQMGPALDRILETIRTVGAEEKFDLVLRGEVVVYGKPALNITDLVIDRLNRDYASGKIRIEAEKAENATPAAKAERKTSDKTRRPAVSDDDTRLKNDEKKVGK